MVKASNKVENANPLEDEEDDEDISTDTSLEDRKKNYTKMATVREQMSDIYSAVVRGFDDKQEQNDVALS